MFIVFRGFINNKSQNFDELLCSENGIILFKEHLKKEFSVENLLFYIDATKIYQSSVDEDSSLKISKDVWIKMVESIYDLYISNNSDFQVMLDIIIYFKVNISSGCKIDFDEGLESNNVDPRIVKNAIDEIYDLMKYDSFERFKRLNFGI